MNARTEIWRLFVALALPDAVKVELARAQRDLQEDLPANCVRWTKPQSFHLTLKFLGNVETNRVEELARSLRIACVDFPAMKLRAEGIGFFPNARRPRVIWAGIQDRTAILPRLQSAVEKSVAAFTNETPESNFAAHVTLGRCPAVQSSHAEVLSKLALRWNRNRSFGEWTVEEFELIRSELASTGSRYTTVCLIPLATDPPFPRLPRA